MPAKDETRPVGDTVPKVDGEIAVGSDLEFQRAWWKFENTAWVLLALFLVANLAGVFGRGWLAHAQARSADGSMTVKYDRIDRFSTPALLTVQIDQSAIRDGTFQIWASDELLKPLGNQRVVPQPQQSVLEHGGILYTFPVRETPASVEFALQPMAPGISHLRLRAAAGNELALAIYTLP